VDGEEEWKGIRGGRAEKGKRWEGKELERRATTRTEGIGRGGKGKRENKRYKPNLKS